jgi:hypothetical protein
VTWLSLDPLVPLGPSGHDSVQGIPLPAALVRDYQRHGVFAVLGARTFDGGPDHGDPDHGGPDHGNPDQGDPGHRHTDRARLLARAHPSGEWVEWLD